MSFEEDRAIDLEMRREAAEYNPDPETGKPVIPGDRLRNGAIVVDMRETGSDDAVILAVWRMDRHAEYVTWRARVDGYGTYAGHYYDTLAEAMTDYERR